jgi:hypothetical protein
LYDLRRRLHRTRLNRTTPRAMARDRQSALKLVELILFDAYRLLAAPAEAVRPDHLAEHDDLLVAQTLVRDLDLPVFARILLCARRVRAARVHAWERLLGEHLFNTLRKLKPD